MIRRIGMIILVMAFVMVSFSSIIEPGVSQNVCKLGSYENITNDPERQFLSKGDGNYITWWDQRNGGNIRLYNITNESSEDIFSGFWLTAPPKIWGDHVVWREGHYIQGNFQIDVVLYNISTKTKSWISNAWATPSEPDISNDMIAWSDNRDGNFDVFTFDLNTWKERKISRNLSESTNPIISKDKIFWTENRNGNSSYGYYFDEGFTGIIGPSYGDPGWIYRSYDAFENRTVWVGYFNETYRLYYSDVFIREGFTLVHDTDHIIRNPKIWNNKVIWVESNNSKYDLNLYDIEIGKQFLLLTSYSPIITEDIWNSYGLFAREIKGIDDVYLYFFDKDNDGVGDFEDEFPDNPNEYRDLDKDGIGDNLDIDADGDRINDAEDMFPYDEYEWSDYDGDGSGDNIDDDDDNDGIADINDSEPFNPFNSLNDDFSLIMESTTTQYQNLIQHTINLTSSIMTSISLLEDELQTLEKLAIILSKLDTIDSNLLFNTNIQNETCDDILQKIDDLNLTQNLRVTILRDEIETRFLQMEQLDTQIKELLLQNIEINSDKLDNVSNRIANISVMITSLQILNSIFEEIENLEKEINQEFEKENLQNKKDNSYSIVIIIIILLILIVVLIGYMFSIKKMQIQNEEDE